VNLIAQIILWAASIVCKTTINGFIVGIQTLVIMADWNELEADLSIISKLISEIRIIKTGKVLVVYL